ncbi:MAG: sialate O-acetylesterase, partial [Acidobacteriia bacterium]|nr:sialate O-acetylesterase [Terriglobia bacterium]
MRLATLAVVLSFSLRANIELPYLIADHMVLQRGLPVHIWGKAEPGETVSVAFRGAERKAVTDPLGRWSVFLPPGEAGGPFAMAVRGANSIALQDILVGDVWVASGQSNMEWPLSHSAGALAET